MTMVIIQLSVEDLRQIIREEISALIRPDDTILSRKEVAQLIGKSTKTVARMENLGLIKRIYPDGHPRYFKREILELKPQFQMDYPIQNKTRLSELIGFAQ